MPNSVSNPNVPVTKQDLADFYQRILPYLGAVGSLNDLSDVLISSATNGQSIKYNATSGKWENATIIDDTASSNAVAWSASKVISELGGKQATLTAGVGITITNGVISANPGISMTIVNALPTEDISATTIYLVPSATSATNNIYDEFVYVNNQWEQIGSTAIDLTNIYTKTEVNSLLTSQSTSQSTIDSTQNSQLTSLTNKDTSLSLSMSEVASSAASLSTENSAQGVSISSLTSTANSMTSEVGSLTTATSEMAGDIEDLGSEVADKQDKLVAGDGIDIDESTNTISAEAVEAKLYWNLLYPTSNE